MEKVKQKIETIIKVWDTYVNTMFKDLLCVFPISIA
jgi:hypothetical protein